MRIELERLRALENEARKDSWSRMLQPPLGMRTPGQEQAQPLVRPPAQTSALPRPPAAMLPDGVATSFFFFAIGFFGVTACRSA